MTAPALALHAQPDVFKRRWAVLAVMSVSLVLVVMSVSGLNVALPTLVRDLGASASQLQWIVGAYALVFAALLLTAGAVGDRFGRKGALLGGFAIFAIGALASSAATTANQLIATRAVMGIGAALIMPATLSIIVSVFPPEERSKAISIWAGVAGLGGTLGQITSGTLLSAFSWPSLFLALLPVAAIAAAATVRLVPTSRDEEQRPLDLPGAGLSLVAMGALVFAIIEAPERGIANPLVLLGLAAALVAGIGFVAWQRRSPHPMVPLDMVSDRRIKIGLGVVAAVFAAMFALFFLLTQYLQFVHGWSTLQAGFANLPIAIGLMVAAPKSDRLVARFGTGPVVTVGLGAMAAGFGLLATLDPSTPYWLMAVGMTLLGLGAGAAMAPSTASVMAALPTSKAGIGSALNDTSREVGAVLGIAILGSVASFIYRANIADTLAGAPDGMAEAVKSSAGAGLAVAQDIGGITGSALYDAVATGFSRGVAFAFALSAALTAIAAVTVAVSTRRQTAKAQRQSLAEHQALAA
jgi:DHA2 family multidrug resistance protein-like MFS transporter